MSDYFRKTTLLREGEEVEQVVRHHLGTMVFPAVVSMVLLVVPFFFMFYLLGHGAWGTAAFLVLVAIALLYAVRAFVLWYFKAFIITNQRIIDVDRTGLFSKTVSEARFNVITDISYNTKGVIQALLRAGTIVIKTQGDAVTIAITNVAHPEQLQHKLIELVERGVVSSSRTSSKTSDTQELIREFAEEGSLTDQDFSRREI